GGISKTAKALVLVIVTGSVTGEPTVTPPKPRLVGAAVTVAAMIAIVKEVCAKHPFESVALIVADEEPAVVGTPETVPPDARPRAAGSTPPDRVNTYGAVPPFPVSNCEYGTPTTPPGRLPRMEIDGHATLPESGMV